MIDTLLAPENLAATARRVANLESSVKTTAVCGLDLAGELVGAAVAVLFDKPNLSREMILRVKTKSLEDGVRLVLIAGELKQSRLKSLEREIKEFRKAGMRIEGLIVLSGFSHEILEALQLLGVTATSLGEPQHG